MVKPVLGDVELQQVQSIAIDGDQLLVEHGVPALEGDFFQRLNRRATCITLNGVLTGAEVADQLKTLRDKFRAAEPVSFVADIASATQIDQVLIGEMGVRELAGKPERFEYSFTLREYLPGAAARAEQPSPRIAPSSPASVVDEQITEEAANRQTETATQINNRQASLEVVVEAVDTNATDFTQMQIRVEGQTEAGESLSTLLTVQENGVFRKTDIPAGDYTISLQIGA